MFFLLFEFSSIEQYDAQLQEEKLTCVQAVEHYLQRIETHRHLNAFIEVFKEEAIQRACDLDEKRKNNRPASVPAFMSF